MQALVQIAQPGSSLFSHTDQDILFPWSQGPMLMKWLGREQWKSRNQEEKTFYLL